ncbi:nuclear transport factor 2 family protein [Bauldia sp.]|uniref:nuclear transport factor 2 family protein n=1 Tax=Bauldia sp. TaxID=2575872 RepID=UPI003BAD1961
MTRKPWGLGGAIFGFVLTMIITTAGAIVLVATAPAQAAEAAGLNAEGEAAVGAWIAAVASGDPDQVRALSAPEFQIVRGDGSVHALEDYLTDLPALEAVPPMRNVFATATGDQMVVRYTVDAIKDVDGVTVDAFGPRLTVLRKQGDVWLVVAHANFSTVPQDPGAPSINDPPAE